jgi:hypothetical protein
MNNDQQIVNALKHVQSLLLSSSPNFIQNLNLINDIIEEDVGKNMFRPYDETLNQELVDYVKKKCTIKFKNYDKNELSQLNWKYVSNSLTPAERERHLEYRSHTYAINEISRYINRLCY